MWSLAIKFEARVSLRHDMARGKCSLRSQWSQLVAISRKEVDSESEVGISSVEAVCLASVGKQPEIERLDCCAICRCGESCP